MDKNKVVKYRKEIDAMLKAYADKNGLTYLPPRGVSYNASVLNYRFTLSSVSKEALALAKFRKIGRESFYNTKIYYQGREFTIVDICRSTTCPWIGLSNGKRYKLPNTVVNLGSLNA